MSKKPTYKINKSTIAIKIPIETDEHLRKVILDNAWMYNKIRNDFVEEADKYKGEYCMYDDFDPLGFKTTYYNMVEKPEHRYDYYCVGLSEQVAENFYVSRKAIRTTNRKIFREHLPDEKSEYHFKPFNYNKYTFRVKLKPDVFKEKVRGRLKVHSKHNISVLIRSNKFGRPKEVLSIKLNLPLYDDIIDGYNPIFIKRYKTINGIHNECIFNLTDIKDIIFKYEDGKYYVHLTVNVTYLIDKKSRKHSKGKIAGIDTGIRHPITIYDGGQKPEYRQMDDKVIRKIHKIEKRIHRLQSVRDIKKDYNEDHNLEIHSNNVEKVSKKIRKLYRKVHNIKVFWAQNIAKEITTTYSAIVVDDFNQPDNRKEKLPVCAKHKINYENRFHIMFYTNTFIKHDCDKYGCKYVKSPEYTTCTCSVCKHINPHLKLTDKYLVCERCGSKIERDENAAKNCYDYLVEMS